MIAFDFSVLSTPYRLKRCSYQMMHMALIAESMGEEVLAIVSRDHLDQHKFMKKIRRLWCQIDKGGKPIVPQKDIEIYVAKADTYYRDDNWERVKTLPAYKVCLCNSDKLFRESDVPYKRHRGHQVQNRADLYMPVNHSAELLRTHDHKIVPAAHPIDPRMYEFFEREGLYTAYLADDIGLLRERFKEEEIGAAGFMGNQQPAHTRVDEVEQFPSWAEFKWTRTEPSPAYIKWMMQRRGCIDMRGNGDKSLRFVEAAMLGRTLICKMLPSEYWPKLVNDHNCILVDDWRQLPQAYNRDQWLKLAARSTQDYLGGWSLRAQVKTFIGRARCGQSKTPIIVGPRG